MADGDKKLDLKNWDQYYKKVLSKNTHKKRKPTKLAILDILDVTLF